MWCNPAKCCSFGVTGVYYRQEKHFLVGIILAVESRCWLMKPTFYWLRYYTLSADGCGVTDRVLERQDLLNSWMQLKVQRPGYATSAAI